MKPTKELVTQARSGDVHAFALLYETIYRDLYRFARYTLRTEQDAEDAVSETVLEAFAQIENLREADAFGAWIFRILTSCCSRRIRQYARTPGELDDYVCAPETDLSGRADLQRAFASLPEEDRLIISMNVFAGYSSQEIGLLLHMNPNTVRSRQSRALKKLEQQLT